jgi:hypothetical protein
MPPRGTGAEVSVPVGAGAVAYVGGGAVVPSEATTNTESLASSWIGVPVMPSGSILRQGSAERGVGGPRLTFQRWTPSTDSPYTLLFSVATIRTSKELGEAEEWTTIGEA